MYRPYIIRRDGRIDDRASEQPLGILHQCNGDGLLGLKDLYWLELHDLAGNYARATVDDLEATTTAIIPDRIEVNPYFPTSPARLYFRTQDNAARFAYDASRALVARLTSTN